MPVFTTQNFGLQNGRVLAELALAYETYGRLAPERRNAVLVAHGYTSSAHAARNAAAEEPGWWDNVVGPGRAIDTERYFAVCSNMLGSSYGSTGPASIDPATGKPYGPDFPEITLGDIVAAQKLLLEHLGVRHLVAVAGLSYGGYQAFQWGVTYPDFMDGVVAVASAPKGNGGEAAVQALTAQLAQDPNWNGGRYYENGGILETMVAMRIDTLRRYGLEAQLAPAFPDPAQREQAIRALAYLWARNFDGNSLLVLRRAAVHFDAERDFAKFRAKLLYVLSRTDKLFPPALAAPVMDKLKAAGIAATYFELDSELGHLASNPEADKWTPVLRQFLAQLEPARA